MRVPLAIVRLVSGSLGDRSSAAAEGGLIPKTAPLVGCKLHQSRKARL
jgi:hypothetical protein